MLPEINSAKSFHLLDEWVTLTERWCNVRAHRINLTGEHGGQLQSVVYQSGSQIIQPLLAPYLGFEFTSTPTDQAHRITRQWHEVAELFVSELRKLGWNKWLCLPPSITDVRPFTWAKAQVSPRFTYLLPVADAGNDQLRSPDVRRRCKKAAQEGYVVEHNDDLDAMMASLKSTEAKQGFDYAVTRENLAEALAALGPDRFRIYNAYDKDRQPVSTMVALYRPGAPIQEWVAGTVSEHLKSGVSQLVFAKVLEDVQTLDAPVFDFCGANFPSVAAAKLQLGGTLTTYYQLEPQTWRQVAKSAVKLIRHR